MPVEPRWGDDTPSARYRTPSITLANLRANGVRSLLVRCELCQLNVDRFGEDVSVPAFAPRMVFTSCGIIVADVQPNWRERPVRETMPGWQWER